MPRSKKQKVDKERGEGRIERLTRKGPIGLKPTPSTS